MNTKKKEFGDRLDALVKKGNAERIVGIGSILLEVMGMEVPRSQQTFLYDRYNSAGMQIAEGRKNIGFAPPGTPRDQVRNVRTSVIPGHHASRGLPTSNYIEGEYLLTINGRTFMLARGDESTETYDPVNGATVVNIKPKAQNFPQKARVVNPIHDTEHWMWLWMHPRNVDSPARLCAEGMPFFDKFADAGITLKMSSFYYESYNTPLIKANSRENAIAAKIGDDNDAVRYTTKIGTLKPDQLKALSLASGIVMSDMDRTVSKEDLYRSHLYRVVTYSGTDEAGTRNRDKIRALLNGGDDYHAKVVQDAAECGALVEDNGEFFIVGLDGSHSQPEYLDFYTVPPHSRENAMGWLAAEIEYKRDDKLLNAIDMAANEHKNRAYGNREVKPDAVSAIDHAIATGRLKAVETTKGKGNWTLEDGTVVCEWKGFAKEQQRKFLMTWASSFSVPALLAQLGIVEETH